MPKLGAYPPLERGKDLQTLTDNSLALMTKGMSKGEAMATALNLAGLRPEAFPSSTKPSSGTGKRTPKQGSPLK